MLRRIHRATFFLFLMLIGGMMVWAGAPSAQAEDGWAKWTQMSEEEMAAITSMAASSTAAQKETISAASLETKSVERPVITPAAVEAAPSRSETKPGAPVPVEVSPIEPQVSEVVTEESPAPSASAAVSLTPVDKTTAEERRVAVAPAVPEDPDDVGGTAPVVVPPAEVEVDEPEPQPQPRRARFRIGPEVGIYFPTDSLVRDRFGDSWFTWGIAFGGVGVPNPQGQWEPDISFIYRNNNNGHVFLAPLGISYRKGMSSTPNASNNFYVGASANAVIASVRSEIDQLNTRTRVVPGASVFAGVTIRDNAYLEARYRVFGKASGFDFSGAQLSAGFRF